MEKLVRDILGVNQLPKTYCDYLLHLFWGKNKEELELLKANYTASGLEALVLLKMDGERYYLTITPYRLITTTDHRNCSLDYDEFENYCLTHKVKVCWSTVCGKEIKEDENTCPDHRSLERDPEPEESEDPEALGPDSGSKTD